MSVERRSITRSFAARAHLAGVAFDDALLPGAKNMLTRSLGLTAGQRLVLIVEVGLDETGAAVMAAADEEGIDALALLVGPDQANNAAFVRRLTAYMADSDASAFLGSYGALSTGFRRQLVETATGDHRHAHLAGITPDMLRSALRTDFTESHRFGEALRELLRGAQRLEVRSGTGTDLRITLGPGLWHHASNVIAPGEWSRLPGGELLTIPLTVSGVLVPDGGAFLPNGREHPRSGRMELHFDDSRLTGARGIEGDDPLLTLLDDHEGCKRVGHVSLGTNIGLLVAVGALLQDRTAPGFHLTLGHPAGELGGAEASSPVEIPLFVRRADVLADGTPFLVRGRYARALRDAAIA